MIKTPTLFVLGAGASQPYGLPLGSELRTLICSAENENSPAARAIVREDEFTQYDIRNVARTFLRSNVKSIDEFLGRYPHLVQVGKALIAAFICSHENPAAMFGGPKEDHWWGFFRVGPR